MNKHKSSNVPMGIQYSNEEKGALKIRARDDCCIKEEIVRREALEDPDHERFDD